MGIGVVYFDLNKMGSQLKGRENSLISDFFWVSACGLRSIQNCHSNLIFTQRFINGM